MEPKNISNDLTNSESDKSISYAEEFSKYLNNFTDRKTKLKDFECSTLDDKELSEVAEILLDQSSKCDKISKVALKIYKKIHEKNSKLNSIIRNSIVRISVNLLQGDIEWSSIELIGKFIADLFNHDFVYDQVIVRFLSMCKNICVVATTQIEGIEVVLKTFKTVAQKMEIKNREKYIKELDFVYKISMMTLPKVSETANSILNDFDEKFKLDKNVGNANPSFKYAVKAMVESETLEFCYAVQNVHECAKFYVHHAIKMVNVSSSIPVSFLQKHAAQPYPANSNEKKLIAAVIKTILELFSDQFENYQGELTPSKTCKTSLSIKYLYKAAFITDEEVEKCIQILLNNSSDIGLTALNVHCLVLIDILAYIKRNPQKCSTLGVKLDLHGTVVERSNFTIINPSKLPEKGEIIKPKEFKYCPINEISTRDTEHCANILVENISNLPKFNKRNAEEFYEFYKSVKNYNFLKIFVEKLHSKVVLALIVPSDEKIKWKQVKNLGMFVCYFKSEESCARRKYCRLDELYAMIHTHVLAKTIKYQLELKTEQLMKVIDINYNLSQVVDGMFLCHQVFMFDRLVALKGKVNEIFDKLTTKIISKFDKSLLIDAENLIDDIFPTFKMFVHEIIYGNEISFEVIVNDVQKCSEFFVKNAQFYPYSKSKEFAKHLKVKNAFEKEVLQSIVEQTKKSFNDLFLTSESRQARQTVGICKFIAELWLIKLIDDEFVKFCDEEIVEKLKDDKSDISLLCCLNFCIYLRDETKKSKRKKNILINLIEKIDLKSIQHVKFDEDLDEIDKIKIKPKKSEFQPPKIETIEPHTEEEEEDEDLNFKIDSFKLFLVELNFCTQNQIIEKIKNIEIKNKSCMKIMVEEFLDHVSHQDVEGYGKIAEMFANNFTNFQEMLIPQINLLLREKLCSNLKSKNDCENYQKKVKNVINFIAEIFEIDLISFDNLKNLLKTFSSQVNSEIVLKILSTNSNTLLSSKNDLSFILENDPKSIMKDYCETEIVRKIKQICDRANN